MKIIFRIGDTTAEFTRNWFTARASLNFAGQTFVLQNPWNLATQFGLRRKRIWEVNLPHHKVSIEKTRPWVLAAFRSNSYRILLDGELVAEDSGY